MDRDDDDKAFTWEASYTEGLNIRHILQEDERGSIETSIRKVIEEAHRRAHNVDRPQKCRLGVMRYLYLVLDCSRFMQERTLPPNKLSRTVAAINAFAQKFFELNPIGQIGLVVCKDRRAERLVGLTTKARKLEAALATLQDANCVGDFSLQNALRVPLHYLKDLPAHFSREILIIMSALSSVDPGSIYSTVETLKNSNIRCSVVGLSAELFVCSQLVKSTKGRYSVVVDSAHLELELSSHAVPQLTGKQQDCTAINVGFPTHKTIKGRKVCFCHRGQASSRGFLCPRCGSKYCSLPIECKTCGLMLIAAPQLSRAARHMQPLAAFTSLEPVKSQSCFACNTSFEQLASVYECTLCRRRFCLHCDLFIHESLLVCPGCQ